MPVSKKTSALAEQIKKDMVNYIGPIFEELKTEIRQKADSSKIESMRLELIDKINWQGTIMDEMRKDIRTALEASTSVLNEEGTVKNHEERISTLENDVKVLKLVRAPTESN